jgi:hypothetical protein
MSLAGGASRRAHSRRRSLPRWLRTSTVSYSLAARTWSPKHYGPSTPIRVSARSSPIATRGRFALLAAARDERNSRPRHLPWNATGQRRFWRYPFVSTSSWTRERAIPQWDVDGHEVTHGVNLVEGTLTAELFPAEIGVNSLHHQVVDEVGQGLVVSAKATDGVVEGLETPDGSIVAVQWHPELLKKPDPTFQWLVRAAVERRVSE